MLETLNRDDFAQHSGDIFKAEFSIGNFTDVELIEVSELKDHQDHTFFSLVFLAPIDAPTDPLTINLKHNELGSFEIYLSPFSKDETGVKYEAAFSRLAA